VELRQGAIPPAVRIPTQWTVEGVSLGVSLGVLLVMEERKWKLESIVVSIVLGENRRGVVVEGSGTSEQAIS